MQLRRIARIFLFLIFPASCFAQAGTPVTSGSWYILNEASDIHSSDLGCYSPSQVNFAYHNATITMLRNVGAYSCGGNNGSNFSTTQNYLSGSIMFKSLNYKPTAGNPVVIQASMKLATGWPTLWLLGANCQATSPQSWDNFGTCNWPFDSSDSAEIDIQENIGTAPFTSTMENAYNGIGSFQSPNSGSFTNGAANFHLYKLVWSTSSLCWYIDGVQVQCQSSVVPLNSMFPIIENRVNNGSLPAAGQFPNIMTVKYFQVCQAAGISSCTADDVNSGNTIFLDDFGTAGTINASSCSQSDVQSAINSATTGQTVLVPGGTATWTSLSIPAGVTVNGGGVGGGPGAGTGACTVTINTQNAVQMNLDGTNLPRFTQFKITSTTQAIFIDVNGNGPALIDHNNFTGGAASEMIHNLGLGPSGTAGWTNNVTPGAANMLYVEDNTFACGTGCGSFFTGTSAIQAYYGARTVFRHNTVTSAQVDQHGTAGNIGARWWEIYDNTFVTPNINQSNYMALRAGSGVVWGNTHTGVNTTTGDIELVEEDSGYPALYQIGRGINQLLSPAYLWGNDASMAIVSGSSNVQLNRDYFVSASQPATLLRCELTTDTGTSSSCSTTYNYVPFTYPYPTGSVAIVSLSPASIAFSNQTVLVPSISHAVTVSNIGNATLNISGISITGANTSSFSQSNTCSSTLAAGSSCTVNVTFTPAVLGPLSASVSVADDASGSPQTAPLTGTGVSAIAAPVIHPPIITGKLMQENNDIQKQRYSR